MALIRGSFRGLPVAAGSAHGLPTKLGQPLRPSYERRTPSRITWTAFSEFSNSAHSRIQQRFSSQNLTRPCHLHCRVQPLIATRTTPLLRRILPHEQRRLSSETSTSGSKDSAVGPVILLVILVSGVVASPFCYCYSWGWNSCAEDLTSRIPGGKIFNERKALRKEEKGTASKEARYAIRIVS